MSPRLCLPAFAGALFLLPLAGHGEEKPAPEAPAEARVRLRLNAIETATLLGRYESLLKRELGLHENVRACVKSGDNRLPEYQQVLQEVQDDLEQTKKRLTTLEAERAKLTERPGKKGLGDPSK
jgi:hypothetical protein